MTDTIKTSQTPPNYHSSSKQPLTGLEIYSLYLSLRLHFTTNSYDYFKYGVKKVNEDTYKMKKEYFIAERMTREFGDFDYLERYLVANFINGDVLWMGNINTHSSRDVCVQWNRKMEKFGPSGSTFIDDVNFLLGKMPDKSPSYLFQIDKEKTSFPRLTNYYLKGFIQFETYIVLCNIFGMQMVDVPSLARDDKWQATKTLFNKYAPFVFKYCENSITLYAKSFKLLLDGKT